MTTVEIEAKTLARLMDMSKDNHENTLEALDDEELPDTVYSDLRYMADRQESAIETGAEVLQQQADVDIEGY